MASCGNDSDCSAIQLTTEVMENVRLARNTYRLRFRCPAIAKRAIPGQFVMLRISQCDDPLIGRPFAVYDTLASTAGEVDAVDIVYVTGGKLTGRMEAILPGQPIDVWGPLGNGFSPPSTDHLIMVAGGIGQTPFFALAAEALGIKSYGDPARPTSRVKHVTLCYGARSADLLAGVDDFQALGVKVRSSTDDGSAGHHGFVTEVLDSVLQETEGERRLVVCCGPEPMMESVAEMTRRYRVRTEVSLETPMACGIGICFSCVAKVIQEDGHWDYRRTCVEGPVFDAEKIAW